MQLQQLSFTGVRNLVQVDMECADRINLIFGCNAAGKTSILEGIHLLSRASSFRTPSIKEIIQHGRDHLSVHASIKLDSNSAIQTGMETTRTHTRIQYAGKRVKKRSEQAKNLPIIAITPESNQLLNGPPRLRRHWLDWSMFHVEPDYMGVWHTYHHALRHRNTLLRKRAPASQFSAWDQILSKSGYQLRTMRGQYLARLVQEYNAENPQHVVEAGLRTQDESQEGLYRQLVEGQESDRHRGHTQTGAHREDVLFMHSQGEANKIFSRGEGKRFLLQLLLAQACLYQKMVHVRPIILIDDLGAELDKENLILAMRYLQAQEAQVFITMVDPSVVLSCQPVAGLFHVEQGVLRNVIKYPL